MTNFSQELTETITMSEDIFKKQPNRTSLEIDGINYDGSWELIKFTEILNEIYSFRVELQSITPNDMTHVREDKIVRIYYGNTTIFKGRITRASYTQDEKAVITGIQSGQDKFRRFDFRNGTNGIYREASAIAANTIFTNIASVNLDGASPFLGIQDSGGSVTEQISIDTNDITTNTRYRAEGDTNRFQGARNLAKLVGGELDWGEDGSGNDTVSLTDQIGSASSVKTFYTAGSNQNVDVANRFNDEEQLWNAVIVKGYAEAGTRISSSEKTDTTSIDTYGRKEKTYYDYRIRNDSEANTLATKIKDDHKDPVQKYTIIAVDETEVLPDTVELGDVVTIEDDNIFESGDTKDFRVVMRQVVFSQEAGFSVTLQCNSRTFEFSEQVAELTNWINQERERAKNQVQDDSVQSTNPATVVDNTGGQNVLTDWASVQVDPNQFTQPEGHGNATEPTTSFSTPLGGGAGSDSWANVSVSTSSLTTLDSFTYLGSEETPRMYEVNITDWGTDPGNVRLVIDHGGTEIMNENFAMLGNQTLRVKRTYIPYFSIASNTVTIKATVSNASVSCDGNANIAELDLGHSHDVSSGSEGSNFINTKKILVERDDGANFSAATAPSFTEAITGANENSTETVSNNNPNADKATKQELT